MCGVKRSLLAAGLMAAGSSSSMTSAYLFPIPTGNSALSTTTTGRAMEARQHRQHARRITTPSPRMASTTMPPPATCEASTRGYDFDGGADAMALGATSTIFPSVKRAPRQGIVARDGTRNDGQRERDDGKSPDFEVNLGKVISTLREDYPRILFDPPQFDIFTEEIELRDPTGVAFRGISNYKRVFATLRFFRQTFMNDASTTFRLTYDWSKQQVRVTWNVVLQLKARQRPIYVDAISAYHINSDGLAYRHDLETVVVNGTPVEPPFAYAWINLPAWVSRGAAVKPGGAGAVPVPHGLVAPSRLDFDHQPLELDLGVGAMFGAAQTDPELRRDFVTALTALMATEGAETAVGGGGGGTEAVASAGEGTASGVVEEADSGTTPAGKNARSMKEKKKEGLFGLQGKLGECDTSFDCTGGMVCCDFVLVKVCCSNGIRQPKFGDLVPSLIPIPGRGRNENDTPVRTPQPRRRTSSGW